MDHTPNNYTKPSTRVLCSKSFFVQKPLGLWKPIWIGFPQGMPLPLFPTSPMLSHHGLKPFVYWKRCPWAATPPRQTSLHPKWTTRTSTNGWLGSAGLRLDVSFFFNSEGNKQVYSSLASIVAWWFNFHTPKMLTTATGCNTSLMSRDDIE